MTTPTIIRHTATKTGFVQIITYFDHNSNFFAVVQQYEVCSDRTVLTKSSTWSTEEGAITVYDQLVEDAEQPVSIREHGLFASPDSMDYVEQWIQKHPQEDHIHLYTAAYMTWNFLAKQVNS